MPTAQAGFLSGLVRGGQQPVNGATVTLWKAGTSGSYGTGATQVGSTTTTDVNGFFNLNTGGGGSTPQCTTGDLNYITVTGGNPGGGTNNALALMAALPTPCNTTTGYPGAITVQVDEVTTVAAVWALQQFMSITPSGSPAWNIGAPSTNQTGLANAFMNANQLASLSTGTSVNSTLTNTVTYPVASANGAQYNSTQGTVLYTSTIAPDINRVNLVADMLSSCVNSTAAISITGWAMNGAGTVATFYTPTNLGAAPGSTVSLSGFSAGTFLNGQTPTVSSGMTGTITAINVTNGGSGYTSPPTIAFSGGGGTGAAATAVLTSQAVTSIIVTSAGSGYTTLPTVAFSGGAGTGAAATVQSGGFTATVTGGTGSASNLSDPGTANVTGATSSTCANLFADVVPTTAVVPTDTIQAAYDIATAPAGLTEYPEAKLGGGSPVAAGATVGPTSGTTLYNAGSCTSGALYCTWALAMCDSFVTGTPPFVPLTACAQATSGTTASYPTDFAIGVRWTAVDNATTALNYGYKAGSVAVDSNGNVWTGYTGSSGGTGYPIAEWSPTGQVLQVLGTNGIVAGSNVNASYKMPATTNVYLNTTSNGEASSSSGMTYASTPSITVAPATYVSSAAYAIAVDTNNNAWVTDSLAGTVGTSSLVGFYPGVVFEIAPATGWSYTSGATSTTSTAGQVTPYITGAISGAIAIDGSNNLWIATSATTGAATGGNLTLMPAGSYNTIYEGQYVTSVSTGQINQVAIDGTGIATGFLNLNAAGQPVLRNSVTTAETPASLTSLNVTGAYTSGPALIPEVGAIDGLNNIWMGEWKSGSGQIAYFPGVTSGGGTVTPSNVNASVKTTGYTANNYFAGLNSPGAFSVDGLGNVFIFNGVTTTNSGVSELTSAGVQLTPTNASTGMAVYGLNLYATDAGRAGAIDESGNMWTGTSSNSYAVHMVGLAAPVTTPTATQVGTNKIGVRP
jgi:hypothetical protein